MAHKSQITIVFNPTQQRIKKERFWKMYQDLIISFKIEPNSKLAVALRCIIFEQKTALYDFINMNYYELVVLPGIDVKVAIELVEFQKRFLKRSLQAALFL